MQKTKILLAIDELELAEQILKSTCNIINKENSEITLINILEITPAEGAFFKNEPEKYIQHEAKKECFSKLEMFLKENGYSYNNFIAKTGNAADEILKESKNGNYDLIVLGSHNKNNIERLFLGSTSYKVVKQSKCSVLIIKPSDAIKSINSPYKTLLTIDESEYSENLASSLPCFIDKSRAELHLLHVKPDLELILPYEVYTYMDLMPLIDRQNEIADKILYDVAKKLEDKNFNVKEVYHLSGDAANTIIDEVNDSGFDLVVAGSGEKGPFDFFTGSVSTKLYEYSASDVLIIKKC